MPGKVKIIASGGPIRGQVFEINEHDVLFSTTQYKKVSMNYFSESAQS